jgi:hypothetical protein
MTVSRATMSMAALVLLGTALNAIAAGGEDLAPPTLPPGQGQPVNPAVPSNPDQGGTLGDRLSRSRGVIVPPPVKDQNVVAPPNADKAKMPVIPPPGTPGGDQTVVPK